MKVKGLMKMSTMTPVREREGDNEDGPLGASMKLTVVMPIAKLKGVFSNAVCYDVELAYKYDDDGNLKSQDSGAIPLTITVPKCKASISPAVGTEVLDFDEAKVKDVVIEPHPGRVATITFKLYVRCDDDEFGRLGGMLKHSVEVSVQGRGITAAEAGKENIDQQELKLPGAGADAEAEPDGPQVH